jgi:O-antigen/teichoic acid export membrane protein
MTGLLKTGSFSDRVVILLFAQIISTGINVFNSFFFARLLGPAGKGDYYLLLLVPNTIVVLVQFGLPAALGFYTARGQTKGIVLQALLLAAIISSSAFAIAVVALPVLTVTIMRGLEPALIIFGLCIIPSLLTATFASAIVIGRQAVRWSAAVSVVQAASATLFLGLLVGGLGLGVAGGVAAFLASSVLTMVGLVLGAVRASATVPEPGSVTYRELFRYGLPLYPASITTFFSYRIDGFLLAALRAEASAPLGYYSMAVSSAEMVLILPAAVSSVFFAYVAASARHDSDRQVLVVARLTFFLTGLAALGVAPVITVIIAVLLPAFGPALPALYVLIPGVVALSVARVLTDYISGLGKTGRTSAIYVSAFVLNVAANLMLIPLFGIVGASAASLISYSMTAVAATLVAARLAGASPLGFWLPAEGDLSLAGGALRAMWRRVTRKGDPRSVTPGT